MQVLECVELTVHKFVRIQTPADFLTSSVWEGVDGGYRTIYELGLHIYLSPQTVFWLRYVNHLSLKAFFLERSRFCIKKVCF